MKFVVDILHPAHVHVFRNFVKEMEGRGHEFLVTAREKECSLELLEAHGIPYERISRQRTGPIGLGREMIERTWRFLRIVRPFDPDYLLSVMGPTIAVAGRLLRARAMVFYDTEMAKITNWFAYPLAHRVVTPRCYQGDVGTHQVRYPGYHELAYLHPDRFQPDPGVLEEVGAREGERLFLLRFVSWQASHDLTERGLSARHKSRLVEILSRAGRLFISSESPLPEDLEAYRLRLPVHRIHHLMAHLDLIVGESATMASECTVLGVPSVFISKSSRGYIDDQVRRYGLVHHFSDTAQNAAMSKVEELVARSDLKEAGRAMQDELLSDHVDVTSWMIDYFEGRP